jgi:peptidoglycan-associated lipoprotein
MKKSRMVVPLVILALMAGGCKKDPPPPPPPVTNGAAEAQARAEAEARARREAEERARREAEERARREAEEKARREATMRTTLMEMVYFDYDQSAIRADAKSILDAKVRILRDNPAIRIRIEGHCDERGSNEYNLALGSRRAEAARAYITAAGISPQRFEIISYGEERPQAQGSTESAWSRNRRAQFQILAGLPAPPK